MKNNIIHAPLILASASPRRLELLKRINITPTKIIPADIDESEKPKEHPKDVALRLATEKAQKIYKENKSENTFILAADTVVACGRLTLPKGETEQDARYCLNRLSGRAHRIYTGHCVITPKGKEKSYCVETRVKFKRLSQQEIEHYIASNEWEGKAGAYGIQGLAEAFVKSITGSHSNIVGLSLYDTMNTLSGLEFFKP
ncbi:MAG: Maf family protein [Bdellovibrionales bacterium]